jgi:MFS transporter, ACS family, D-galactonate transporter
VRIVTRVATIGTRSIPRRRWGIAFLLGLGVLVNYFDRVNLSVSQDALHSAFGISTVTFGYLLSAYSWTYAVPCSFRPGVILDRFGVKARGPDRERSCGAWRRLRPRVATGLVSFLGARLLLGVGEAPTFPANAKAIGYWFPSEGAELGDGDLRFRVPSFASAIGVPALGLLLLRFGWRWSFAATGFLSLLYCAPLLPRSTGTRATIHDLCPRSERDLHSGDGGAQTEDRVEGCQGRAAWISCCASERVWGFVLGFASYNYTFYLLLTWLPSYLSAAHHIDLLHSVLYTSVPWLFATFTDILMGGWLVDRLVQRGRDPSFVRRASPNREAPRSAWQCWAQRMRRRPPS